MFADAAPQSASPGACCTACLGRAGCTAWDMLGSSPAPSPQHCRLHNASAEYKGKTKFNCVWAPRAPGPPPPPPPPPPGPGVLSWATMFSDGAVLQQAPRRAKIWGFASAGERVAVLLDGAAVATAVVDAAGRWTAHLPATKGALGLEHTVVARTSTAVGSEIGPRRVLFGEVWVCSGQSNMVRPVSGGPTRPRSRSRRRRRTPKSGCSVSPTSTARPRRGTTSSHRARSSGPRSDPSVRTDQPPFLSLSLSLSLYAAKMSRKFIVACRPESGCDGARKHVNANCLAATSDGETQHASATDPRLPPCTRMLPVTRQATRRPSPPFRPRAGSTGEARGNRSSLKRDDRGAFLDIVGVSTHVPEAHMGV